MLAVQPTTVNLLLYISDNQIIHCCKTSQQHANQQKTQTRTKTKREQQINQQKQQIITTSMTIKTLRLKFKQAYFQFQIK